MKLLDLFKTIVWAKNGDTTDFSQTNYEAGWAHLGDDTPTVQDFNYVQQMNDKKDQWLFKQLKAVMENAGIEPTEDNINALLNAILKIAKGHSTPKAINAETVDFVDETGHTHSISKASLAQAGIVQLTNATDSEAETLGLTAKAGKTLKGLIDALTRNLSNYIPNSKKSSATDSESEDTVATSKAVYDLNGIKLDKVGGEAFLKTIDYTKANGYTYSGFYRPNGDRLNNLPLNGLMMHITHPHYSTNAHARGICFAYGSLTGNIAWDIFTTAFDANGNHLGQKRIMTELGGTFTGNVTAPNLTATGLINITGNRWERVRATLPDGGYWRWEVNPASKDDPRFNFMYHFANGDNRYLAFPRLDKNETVAYQGWVDEKIQSLITYQKIGNFQIRKYPDGTMIQTYTIRQNDLYEWFEKSFNWAIAFVDTPLIFSKVTTSIGGSHDADVNILTKSNNATCYYHEYEHGGSNQGNVRIQFLAIGRWK